MNKTEYRAYFFGNMYLSQIQQGIQAGHTAVELFNKNPHDASLIKWSQDHKTMILLNGGSSVQLTSILSEIEDHCKYIHLPYNHFNEDESLNFALTCVGVVVPDFIYEKEYFTYDSTGMFYEKEKYLYDNFAHLDEFYGEIPIGRSEFYSKCEQLHNLLRSCRLA